MGRTWAKRGFLAVPMLAFMCGDSLAPPGGCGGPSHMKTGTLACHMTVSGADMSAPGKWTHDPDARTWWLECGHVTPSDDGASFSVTITGTAEPGVEMSSETDPWMVQALVRRGTLEYRASSSAGGSWRLAVGSGGLPSGSLHAVLVLPQVLPPPAPEPSVTLDASF